MHKSRVLFLFIMFLLCAGCMDPNQYTGLNWEPQQPVQGQATVYVYHSKPASCQPRGRAQKALYRWSLNLDGKYRDHLKPNTFLVYSLLPGKHQIDLQVDPNVRLDFTVPPEIEFTVKSGDVVFIRFDYELPGLRYRGYTAPEKSLVMVPHDQAVKQLRDCQLTWAPVYQFAPPDWGQKLQPGFISPP